MQKYQLPKGSADLIILKTLNALKESYGYELVKAIEKASHDIFLIKEGTLYPLLYRMEEQGLVSSKRKKTDSEKVRRYYSLTAKGKRILKEKEIEWKTIFDGMSHVLGWQN